MVGRVVTPPLSVEIARNGLVLVDAVNDVSVILTAVPLRVSWDVRGLILGYAAPGHSGFFHRYACSVLVGSFRDEATAEAAVGEAERYLRTHPAPGVKFAEPLVSSDRRAFVFAFTLIPLGISTRIGMRSAGR